MSYVKAEHVQNIQAALRSELEPLFNPAPSPTPASLHLHAPLPLPHLTAPACLQPVLSPISTSTHTPAVAPAEPQLSVHCGLKTSPLGPVSREYWVPWDGLCLIKTN